MKKFLWSANKDDLRKHHHIRKIATGLSDDNATGCLLDYSYFEKYFKLLSIDLSKKLKLDTDQKINTTN